MKKNYMNKEWAKMEQSEQRFIKNNLYVNTPAWQEKMEKYVPEKLNSTLDAVFYKAFQMIFNQGTGIIEKTYDREKKEQNHKIDAFAAAVKKNQKSFRIFDKRAIASKTANMAVSTIEGVGMGLLGLGIPDIPVFIGVLLKSIYEISLTYGYSYDSEEERIFILKMIETALSHEEELRCGNEEIDSFIQDRKWKTDRQAQTKKTAKALAEELLYLKFIQGIPVVGIVGGISDMHFQKKITDYVCLKYKRRFLIDAKEPNTPT